MEEIYGLVEEAFKGGQAKIQLAAFPFRMTTQNLTRYAYDPNAPFWGMLKSGDDAFLATGRPPSVAVCNRSYVFNLDGADDLDPNAACPPGVATNVANTRRLNWRPACGPIQDESDQVENSALLKAANSYRPLWFLDRGHSSTLR
jgi:murein L,D-transpeptidase YafK